MNLFKLCDRLAVGGGPGGGGGICELCICHVTGLDGIPFAREPAASPMAPVDAALRAAGGDTGPSSA